MTDAIGSGAGTPRRPRRLTSNSGGMSRVRRRWTSEDLTRLVKLYKYRCWPTLIKIFHRPQKAIAQRVGILKREGRIAEGAHPPKNSRHLPDAHGGGGSAPVQAPPCPVPPAPPTLLDLAPADRATLDRAERIIGIVGRINTNREEHGRLLEELGRACSQHGGGR
jgi:hypothetical protein